MIRILLVDDHTLVRRSIRQLLAPIKEIQIAGETSTGIEAVQLARDLHPTVLMLDLKLPDISGLEVAARLLRLTPVPRILILSSAVHHEFPRRMLDAGALGYLTKDASQAELVSAIKTVHKGQPFISAAIANRLVLAKVNHPTQARFGELSNKEMEILLFSLRSTPIADIAKRLHISAKTIHSYRSRLLEKLGVDNDVALLRLAIQEGLITVDEAGVL